MNNQVKLPFEFFFTINHPGMWIIEKPVISLCPDAPAHDYNDWRTGDGDQRGVNGSQSKFLNEIWPISQNQPEPSLL
jgi:hypothetical protein